MFKYLVWCFWEVLDRCRFHSATPEELSHDAFQHQLWNKFCCHTLHALNSTISNFYHNNIFSTSSLINLWDAQGAVLLKHLIIFWTHLVLFSVLELNLWMFIIKFKRFYLSRERKKQLCSMCLSFRNTYWDLNHLIYSSRWVNYRKVVDVFQPLISL